LVKKNEVPTINGEHGRFLGYFVEVPLTSKGLIMCSFNGKFVMKV